MQILCVIEALILNYHNAPVLASSHRGPIHFQSLAKICPLGFGSFTEFFEKLIIIMKLSVIEQFLLRHLEHMEPFSVPLAWLGPLSYRLSSAFKSFSMLLEKKKLQTKLKTRLN